MTDPTDSSGPAAPPPGDLPPDAVTLVLEGVEIGWFRDLATLKRAVGPVLAYRRMIARSGAPAPQLLFRHGVRDLAAGPDLPATFTPGSADSLRTGPLRVENAWYAGSNRLRFYLTGRTRDDPNDRPGALRVWQARPDTPFTLRQVGGLILPEDGPGFLDADLIHPLMPVLIEVAEPRGFTREWVLLPFPSLCPGGVHAAERTATQLGWSPVDEVWRLSRAYLEEMLADGTQDAAPPFAVARIAVRLAGATGAETLVSRPMRDWLSTVFGLGLFSDTETDPDHSSLNGILDDGAARAGRLSLRLPVEMVPTIAALVSRRMDLPDTVDAAAGPFLVAGAVNQNPLWSVAWPLDAVQFGSGEGQPVLERLKAPPSPGRARYDWLAPLHLGIALRPSRPVDDIRRLMPVAPDTARPTSGTVRPTLSVLMTASDPDLTARGLSTLAGQEGIQVADILLRPGPGGTPAQDALFDACQSLFPGRCRWLQEAADPALALDAARAQGSGDHILVLDEATVLYMPDTVGELQDLLARDAGAGSISCALLHEAEFGQGTQVQTASAGIFPSHVSFVAAPRLGVDEPDVLEALPQATYPVIANGFGLCLIRPEAIDATRCRRTQSPGAGWAGTAADLQFGLDAFAAGWRSLCSTSVRAGTTRVPSRRDEIDPLGLACLLPARWDDLLSRVTVLRALRG